MRMGNWLERRERIEMTEIDEKGIPQRTVYGYKSKTNSGSIVAKKPDKSLKNPKWNKRKNKFVESGEV
jgi:hypothetical protein